MAVKKVAKKVVAKKKAPIKKVLAKKKLLSTKKLGSHHFYVSDFTSSFEKSTKIFFKEKIHLELKNIWA
jgi:glutamate racemase